MTGEGAPAASAFGEDSVGDRRAALLLAALRLSRNPDLLPLSNDIRNPAAGDIENPATPVTLMPRPEPVRCWA